MRSDYKSDRAGHTIDNQNLTFYHSNILPFKLFRLKSVNHFYIYNNIYIIIYIIISIKLFFSK